MFIEEPRCFSPIAGEVDRGACELEGRVALSRDKSNVKTPCCLGICDPPPWLPCIYM